MGAYRFIRVVDDGEVARLVLARPPLNILTTEMIVESVTRAIPLRRVGVPEDIPGAVVFLASPEADFITGQTLSVSGGLTMC